MFLLPEESTVKIAPDPPLETKKLYWEGKVRQSAESGTKWMNSRKGSANKWKGRENEGSGVREFSMDVSFY